MELRKGAIWPRLVELSGLSAGVWTKGSLVQFLVGAHAWVVGQVPGRGHTRGNHTLTFLSLFFSLPSPLSTNKINKNFKKEKKRYYLTRDRLECAQIESGCWHRTKWASLESEVPGEAGGNKIGSQETEWTTDRTEITELTNETTLQMAPDFQWFSFGFFTFLMVQRLYAFSRHGTSKSAICSAPGLQYAVWSSLVVLGSSDPHLLVSRTILRATTDAL